MRDGPLAFGLAVALWLSLAALFASAPRTSYVDEIRLTAD